MQTTRMIRPTLPDLWRVLLATLEGRNVEGAPDVARGLAVAGLTGRTAEACGIQVMRQGDDVLVSADDPSRGAGAPDPAHFEWPVSEPRTRQPCLMAS